MGRYTLIENILSVSISAIMATGLALAVNSYSLDIEEEQVVRYLEPIKIAKDNRDVVVEIIEKDPEPIKIDLGTYKITAYCPCEKCCGSWADGLTKVGSVATEGRTIAVDPSVIPLGSVVEIDGVEYVAEDIGGAIKGDRIDVFFNTHEDALEYGVQYHEVFIVEEGN